ncbi:MAG: signal peptide peptidase SppA [Acidobacteria bacterium]|nr:signal peptide peptidase SppA [Acidobacteriota bacterium]
MRRFVCGLAAGLILAPVLIAGVLLGVWWWRGRPPRVEQGTTLVLRLRGSLPEREPVSLPFGEQESLSVAGVWDVIRKAAADRRIAAILLEPDEVSAGWATLSEIRSWLDRFRQSGKPVAAFLRSPSARDYFVAAAAGRITVPPEDVVDLKGLRAELIYARGALDKLGILPEFESMGRYKDGADILTRSSMSAETREVISGILETRFGVLVDAIAKARRKTPAQVRSLLDSGPFLSSQALSAGLVDAAQFEDQARGALARQLGQQKLTTIAAGRYRRVPAGSLGLEGRHKIAMIAAEGEILRGDLSWLGEPTLDPERFARTVRQVRDNKAYRAVILRINSPGGDALASDEMLREIHLLAENKPLVVSMGDIAASGGYALALGGQWIVAHPDTITGSIGIFYGKLTLLSLYERLGIRKELLTRGRFADIDSDARPLSAEARQKLRLSLEELYAGFVRQVAQARKRKPEQIEPLAQGRVWLGSQAKANGLVDEMGGIDRALDLAIQAARIPPSEGISLDLFPPQPGLVEIIERYAKLFSSIPSRPDSAARYWKRLPYLIEIR